MRSGQVGNLVMRSHDQIHAKCIFFVNLKGRILVSPNGCIWSDQSNTEQNLVKSGHQGKGPGEAAERKVILCFDYAGEFAAGEISSRRGNR
jgi:hypothetical protein